MCIYPAEQACPELFDILSVVAPCHLSALMKWKGRAYCLQGAEAKVEAASQ